MKPLRNLMFCMFACIAMLSMQSCSIAPESGQYAVESDAFNGNISVHEGPGVADYVNMFDAVEYYDKENMYSFSHDFGEGKAEDESIYVKFADFGEAWISGTVRYAIPSDDEKMQLLHERYDTQHGIEAELIRQTIERAVYLAGPLMTSQESNSSKRAYLLDVIMDQAQNGVYRVTTQDEKVIDVVSGKEKTIKVSVPDTCKTGGKCVGGYTRSESSPLNDYGIKLYNFTIKKIKYSGPVQDQIAKQQEMNMQMEELGIEAKKAQTQAITTAENAKADVAKANALKDVAVAEAQKATAVAEETAKQKKITDDATFYGRELEAKADRLKVQAGLTPLDKAKIEQATAIGVAEALAKRPVPSIVSGGGTGGTLESSYQMKEMLLLMDQLKGE